MHLLSCVHIAAQKRVSAGTHLELLHALLVLLSGTSVNTEAHWAQPAYLTQTSICLHAAFLWPGDVVALGVFALLMVHGAVSVVGSVACSLRARMSKLEQNSSSSCGSMQSDAEQKAPVMLLLRRPPLCIGDSWRSKLTSQSASPKCGCPVNLDWLSWTPGNDIFR